MKKQPKHILNSPVITLALFLIFIALSWLSLQPRQAHSSSLGEFVERKVSEYNPKKKHTRAEAIADIWNIDMDGISKPVYLFGKDGGKI